jgi:hypothetical protein
MSTVCQSNKEKKRNTHLRVKEMRRNIVSLLSYFRNAVFFPPSLFSLSQSGGWIRRPRVRLAFSPRVKVAESRHGAEGGGFGSPLAGFLPNTEISFLMISMKLLDVCPIFLLIFSPIKTADF